MYPFAKKALTLYLARSEGNERYFGCNSVYITNSKQRKHRFLHKRDSSYGALTFSQVGLSPRRVLKCERSRNLES